MNIQFASSMPSCSHNYGTHTCTLPCFAGYECDTNCRSVCLMLLLRPKVRGVKYASFAQPQPVATAVAYHICPSSHTSCILQVTICLLNYNKKKQPCT